MAELFDSNRIDIKSQPLAYRMRPRTLDEYIGQDHIVGPGRLLRRSIQADQLSSVIFYGPPGTGKTTLARVIANTTKSHFSTINAVLSGVKELREEIDAAKNRLDLYGTRTILFVDEVHRWNKSQQDALLPWVENGTFILIGATTENPFFEVNAALVSRSRIFQLKPLTSEDLTKIAWQAIRDKDRGYGKLDVSFEEGALEHLVDVASGDARSLLNALELAVVTSPRDGDKVHITKETAEESIQRKAVLYDKEGDYHFDVISAFIKSLRGSDPDAALYWLAKMVYAGEDPRFIFRRMMISACEDVGLADPNAIVVVQSDAAAFNAIGMPEGRYHLAHAALFHELVVFGLPREDQHRRRIDPRPGDPGQRVGRARPGGHERQPEIAGVLPRRVGGDGGGLLVEVADVADPALAERIDEVHRAATRQHEAEFDPDGVVQIPKDVIGDFFQHHSISPASQLR